MKLTRGAFYGSRRYLKDLDGLCFSEYAYAPSQRIAKHCHAASYLSVVLQGAYKETRSQSEICCEVGTALFHPAEESYRDRFEETGGHLFSMELDARWVYRLREERIPVSEGFVAGRQVAAFGSKLASVVRQNDFSHLYAEGLALELPGLLPRSRSLTQEGSEPPWLKLIEDALHEHSSQPMSLRRICDDVGIHPSHVGRTFKRFRGCSMSQCIRRLRIQQAKMDLRHPRKSLGEIAASLGFSDQSHFSRMFKRETGLSPKRFQKDALLETSQKHHSFYSSFGRHDRLRSLNSSRLTTC